MATPTILLGFSVVFWCLQFLGTSQMAQIHASQSFTAQLAAGAFVLAVATTFALTLLLLFAYVRALGANRGGGGGGPQHFLERLAKAVLAAAAASLLASAALGRVVAAGPAALGGGGDVGWPQAK